MDDSDECPNSPKVRSRKKRTVEKRARLYEAAEGERLFCIESRPEGMLLLRSNLSFAYVHDSEARFSEGVQGKYNELPDNKVELQPQSFGFCYAESFDVNEIVGVCHVVSVTERRCEENGFLYCTLEGDLLKYFSWLDPSKEEVEKTAAPNGGDEVSNPGTISLSELAELECPCSPKIAGRTRKDNEKRVCKYQPAEGERLYTLDSNRSGVLLLRPNSTFAYVHTDRARFSEGVQGDWSEQSGSEVVLYPSSFGYCYWDSFDDHEIIGACQSVTLSSDACESSGRILCRVPPELAGKFSWLEPDREEEVVESTEAMIREQEMEEEPNSPKVPRKRGKKRNTEKRAHTYEPADGERLFCLESHLAGLLLLRPDGSFAYVHDSEARFSEGVQGDWSQQPDDKVKLEPKKFGYIYAESFDDNEIIGVCHDVTLSQDRRAENGKLMCTRPPGLQNKFSWLDPTGEESPKAAEKKDAAAPAAVATATVSRPVPTLSPLQPLRRKNGTESLTLSDLRPSLAYVPEARMSSSDEDCPNSPKVRTRKRRSNEKRAYAHEPEDGEQLFSPESHQAGLLLLRANGTFAYVHDSQARFSEGVQGRWTQQPDDKVVLDPKSFGWCYQESFDADEIVGARHVVTLGNGQPDERGRKLCVLPEELQKYLSWLDPTKEEAPRQPATRTAAPAAMSLHELAALESPCSPKIAGRTRKDNEKMVYKYRAAEGERLYCLDSNRSGVLLLRPDGTFAYVHKDQARFSEGVQGEWSEQPGDKVVLYPSGFGYCYWDSFDACEIIGVCHALTLSSDTCESTGRTICRLSDELATKFSWLNPDREEVIGSGSSSPREQEMEEECPNSPKVPSRKKRSTEKRARAYEPEEGEQLFCPESHVAGILLLRPNGSFSYVYDSDARFSEGVQGDWSERADSRVRLEPKSFGYIYAETFDDNEIVGNCHEVTLSHDRRAENGKLLCILPEALQQNISWMDPTKAEVSQEKPADEKASPANREVPLLAPPPSLQRKMRS